MSLEAIGQKLKSAREAQGLSLRHIYERTKIPINHLQSIDQGLPDALPEPVYVAGFIKRYAECIGLDGQVLADEYRRLDNGNGNGKPKTMPAQPVYVTSDYLKHARIDNRAPSYKLFPFYALAAIALIMVLSWYFSSKTNNAAQTDPNMLSLKDSIAHLPQQPATQVAAVPAATPGRQNPAAGTTAAASGSDNKLTLTASKHVWVQVSKLSSDETVYIGFLEQGSPRVFDDPQGLRVRAGNGGSLSVEWKGKTEPFGPDGHPLERTFVPDTAQAAAAGNTDATAAAGATASGTTSGTAAGTTSAKNSTAKKPTKKSDGTTVRTTHRWRSDDGLRSIPGDGDGMRSIDVPYRYSEGRLDAN